MIELSENIAWGLLGAGVLGPIALLLGVLSYRVLTDQWRRLPAATRFPDIEERVAQKQEELTHLTNEFRQIQAELGQATGERDAAKSEAEYWREQSAAAKREFEEADRLHAKLEEVGQELADKWDELAHLKETLVERKAEIEAANKRLEALKMENSAEDARSKEFAARREQLESEIGRLADQCAAEAEKRDELRRDREKEIERLEAIKAKQADTLKAVEALREDAMALKATIASLEATKKTLEASIGGIGEEGEAGDDPAQELQQLPSCFVGARPQSVLQEESKALDRFRQHLLDVGLQFPERVLWAFHTCLKIADISPLTVLAGISGTGKSELPRRYAESIGLDFLMVPVQPRWDGPQDLIGFYNYLEKRFKATDLTRALVRFDPKNWPDYDKGMDKHVLLVLLDEMNLAHVEYYFSDFLSLLEIRRTAPDRAVVKIDLGNEQRDLRLAENAVFVGTMNEDETTQTLSDKVLDRANLLRFTRPRQFSDRPPPSHSESKQKDWLPFDIWKNWQRGPEALNEGEREKINSWIGELNSALDRLGRPFGHRVQQAIWAYAANHPKVASKEEPLATAFNDQLEQRIFPKLRGLDPEIDNVRDGLDDIANLLRKEELNDPALIEAFDRARGQPLFVWAGVQRDRRDE